MHLPDNGNQMRTIFILYNSSSNCYYYYHFYHTVTAINIIANMARRPCVTVWHDSYNFKLLTKLIYLDFANCSN